MGNISIHTFIPGTRTCLDIRFFFWSGSVGTSLASQKFPPEHRLLLLHAGPFQLFFAFSTFFVLLPFFSFFSFLFFLIFVVPSLFIRKASRQQLIRIFPKYTTDTQPCDGPPSRLHYFECGYRCDWRGPKIAVSLLSLQPHVPRF